MQLPRTHGEWPNRDQLLTVRIHVVSKNRCRKHGFKLPEELVAQRVALDSSGGAGTHQDQKARTHRTGATNRIGNRSARTRAAIRLNG